MIFVWSKRSLLSKTWARFVGSCAWAEDAVEKSITAANAVIHIGRIGIESLQFAADIYP